MKVTWTKMQTAALGCMTAGYIIGKVGDKKGSLTAIKVSLVGTIGGLTLSFLADKLLEKGKIEY